MTIIYLRKPLGLCGMLVVTMLIGTPAVDAVDPLERQLNIQDQSFEQRQLQQVAERLAESGVQRVAQGDYEDGIVAWQEAIALYSRLGNSQAVDELSQSLARTLILLERYDDAENVIQQRLSIAWEKDDVPGQIYGLNNLGMVYVQQGKLASAQDVFAEALQLANGANDETGIGLSLSNLGLAAWRLGDLENARRYYEAATNYRLQADDDLGLAHSSNSLGTIYQLLGEESKALGAYRMARNTALEISHVPTLLIALDGLIGIYSDRGELELLSMYIEERMTMTQENAPLEQQLGLYIGLGKYYEHLDEMSQARAAYRRALELAEQIGDAQQETYIFNQLQTMGGV